MRKGVLLFLTCLIFISFHSAAQQQADSLLQEATLENCIAYAVEKQAVVQQAQIDEAITEAAIKSKLSEWFPQVNFNYTFQHNFEVQTSVIGGNPVKLGVDNTSGLMFTLNQAIFNRDVLLASRTRADVRQQAKQNTESVKIDVVANVSKAFYDVLTTEQQIKVSDENIVRLERSYKDAYNQYQAGITDKTDYKRAAIALNNTVAAKKSYEVLLKARIENLKAQMNYPVNAPLQIAYDSTHMEKEILLDTSQTPDYTKRIEYQLLSTQQKLQEANVQYNKWSFLPQLSANGAYNLNYLNNDFNKLYNQSYPASYAGLTLSFPIFQGGKRKYEIRQAQWQLRRTNLDIVSLRNAVNAEYNAALANYKSNYAGYMATKENMVLAKEVYDIIQLQYKSGIKTYLEVITSETDLRSAQINYYNALYELLASKIDVQKALGEIRD
ncbi:TolC family protein [Agriterribacter sp.]|uniref:TolC family protein n=1 Tax=Agriterribacter sp. TaxID=2821509 RepID=UPI002C19E583|nr:TolC family protein [Agriterribacter sp.]HRO46922.1 TolC family protein [Agriterribacter sp.]HRQ17416.1 TolC family protein [Agriterribacter sp.]